MTHSSNARSIAAISNLASAEEFQAVLHQIDALSQLASTSPAPARRKAGQGVLNGYRYQSSIPIKGAVVISRFRDLRLGWRHWFEDHDGDVGVGDRTPM